VLAVTDVALGPAVRDEGLLVLAPVEELAVAGMAGPADLGDARDLRRERGVIAVAIVAGRRAEVAALEQGNTPPPDSPARHA
jgi:hypothetical protein